MNPADITAYFRSSLADEQILDATKGNGKSIPVPLSHADMAAGVMPKRQAEALLGKARQCEALIAPIVLARRYERKGQFDGYPNFITPMLVPCLVDKQGYISQRKDSYPWIVREHLEPLVSDIQATFCDVDDVDEYITAHRADLEDAPWQTFYLFFADMLKSLVGACLTEPITAGSRAQAIISVGGEEYCVISEPRIFAAQDKSGASWHLRRLYADIAREDSPPAAYQSFVCGCKEERPLLTLSEETQMAATCHLGQMSNAFGLGPSQRQTIHHFFGTRKGEVLAVNGPPGTGKTTLLQSAIASLWVESVVSAKDNKPTPPIIVASSTNNQAVTNVIRDFGQILDQKDAPILATRWLPDEIPSLGAYAVSDSKLRELEKQGNPFLTLRTEWNSTKKKIELDGYFRPIEREEYLQKAYSCFVQRYSEFDPSASIKRDRIAALKGIRKNLRTAITDTVSQMQEALSLWAQCYADAQELPDIESSLTECTEAIELARREQRETAKQLAEAEQQFHLARQSSRAIADAILKEPFWESLLNFLPFVRRRRAARAKSYALRYGLPTNQRCTTLQDVSEAYDGILSAAEKHLHEIKKAASINEREIAKHLQTSEGLQSRLNTIYERSETLAHQVEQTFNGEPPEAVKGFTRESLYALSDYFDRHHRFTAFLLTVHYYEALWLEKSLEEIQAGPINNTVSLRRLQRVAMLTPCFVSTLYMVPKFFRAGAPWYESIDLLIIDEAGQSGPDKAAAVMALAKRALVVGDVYQIEPVYSIPTSVDKGNLKRHNLPDEPEKMPYSVASGSAMHLAQAASPYHCILGGQPAAERGMYLLEHRRCHKDIIGYCKDLVYSHLQVLTATKDEAWYTFPPMGYMHIPSSGTKAGGSWGNEQEAQSIALWLTQNRQAILTQYETSNLADAVGIVTPFARQSSLIRKALQQHLPESEHTSIVVGTVHKLQGAEKPMVIFSSVYGPENTTSPFFDRGPNMLNVAVSRAKHSFLLFGNMGMFPQSDSGITDKRITPSRMLAKHIRAGSALS